MDIHPHAAFAFVAGHEITHHMKDHISEAAWKNFERYAIKAMGGKKAVADKQASHKKYAKKDVAREEVACDFVGKLLSDKAMLSDFCEAIKNQEVSKEAAKGAINAIKSIIGRFTNKLKKGDTATAELIDKVKKAYDTDIKTATNAIKALQTAFNEATKSDALLKNKNTTNDGGVKHSFKGYDAETGRGMYESNFPKGTPKSAKAAVILDYIQNVWSKKPINLVIQNPDGTTRKIQAQFDPTYDPNPHVRTDASKLMGGNRHGTSSDQRVTLDLASDYYQIASESTYNYSKAEEGKTSAPHEGVRQWHYFINDILFYEYGEDTGRPYRVTINVKEKSNGSFVYSFSAELQEREGMSTRQTLHADVTPTENSGGNAHSYANRIAVLKEKSNPSEAKNIKRDAKTTSDSDFFATEDGNKLIEEQSEKPKKQTKEDFRFPTKAEADVLAAKRAKREAQREADRIKQRDEIMKKFVETSPANRKATEE